jgi:hypothetical protein
LNLFNLYRMLSLILLLAITHSAVAQLKYNIVFYKDKTCGQKYVSGDDWVPGTCYPVLPGMLPNSGCIPPLSTSSCDPGMLLSIGAKLTEDSPGKQVTITGFSSIPGAYYLACKAANGFTGNYDCDTAVRAAETCNTDVPSCPSGSKKCTYGGGGTGGVLSGPLVNKLAIDTCAALSDETCKAISICSVKIIGGLQAGAIVGIVIGVIALLSIGGVGFAYYKKIGPYAPGASWSTFLKLSQAAPTKAEVATEPKATDVGVVIRNPTAA